MKIHSHPLSLPLALGLLAYSLGTTLAAPPPNDDIGAATVITDPLPFTQQLSTVEATTAAGDPNCAGAGPTVWFSYLPSASGWLDCDTFGSSYDTTLSVYTGTPGSLTQLRCNDDSGSGVQSRVVLEVTAGTRYYFMVGAYASGPGGNLVFRANPGVPPVAVSMTVADVAVQPSTGTATLKLQISAGQPVPLLFLSANLLQRTGRGSISAATSMPVGELTDSLILPLTLKDPLSLREHGTGFVGGPAKFLAELVYEDPALGVQFKQLEVDVKLKGGNAR